MEAIIGAAIEVHKTLGPGLKATGLKRALLINFGAVKLADGIKRISL
jgi:hypothetical protein